MTNATTTWGRCIARDLVISKNGNYRTTCQNSVTGPGRVICTMHGERIRKV